jgi:hypothetical protein
LREVSAVDDRRTTILAVTVVHGHVPLVRLGRPALPAGALSPLAEMVDEGRLFYWRKEFIQSDGASGR